MPRVCLLFFVRALGVWRICPKQLGEELISEFAGCSLDAQAFVRGVCRNVGALQMEFEFVLSRQAGNKVLIGIRFRPAQFVIEVNNG